jgi:hypothetical protein
MTEQATAPERDARGRLLPGHNVRGHTWTSENNPSRGPIDQHPRWRGDSAGRAALHQRVQKFRGKASEHPCEHCKTHQAREWATIHGRAGTAISDYIPLCKKCHVAYDRETRWRKLTAEQVVEIRTRRAAGAMVKDLAAEYGVAGPTITMIVQRKKWGWVE